MSKNIIALLSDFGIDDPYSGIMKGVILSINPAAKLVDISHRVPPGDIQRGAFVIWQASRDFPPGTIFLCVVDPGVGTERKGIILESKGQIFIGPDNGLFSYVTFNESYSVWELSNPELQLENPANTFHGRDIFAPSAAYSTLGKNGSDFGKSIQKIAKLPSPAITIDNNKMIGEVISYDHFGNLFTSLGHFSFLDKTLSFSSWVSLSEITIQKPSNLKILVENRELPFVSTFGEIPFGSCAGLIGSTGLMEIVSNQDSAWSLLNLEIGSEIILDWS